MARIGIGFFVISILTTVGMSADNLIVAHVSGLEAVTIYSVPARIALILAAIVNMICAPMWVANGEALARGDVAWVRRNTIRLVKVAVLLTGSAAAAFVVLGRPVLRLWLGDDFIVSPWLLAGFGASAVLLAASVPYFMVLNAAGRVWEQVKLFAVFTPLVLVAKTVFAYSVGFNPIPAVNAVCYAAIVLPVVVGLSRKVLQGEDSKAVDAIGAARAS